MGVALIGALVSWLPKSPEPPDLPKPPKPPIPRSHPSRLSYLSPLSPIFRRVLNPSQKYTWPIYLGAFCSQRMYHTVQAQRIQSLKLFKSKQKPFRWIITIRRLTSRTQISLSIYYDTFQPRNDVDSNVNAMVGLSQLAFCRYVYKEMRKKNMHENYTIFEYYWDLKCWKLWLFVCHLN